MYPQQEPLRKHQNQRLPIRHHSTHQTAALTPLHPAPTSYPIRFSILPRKPGSEQTNNNGARLSAGLTATLEMKQLTMPLNRTGKPFSSYRDAVRRVTLDTLSLRSLHNSLCVVVKIWLEIIWNAETFPMIGCLFFFFFFGLLSSYGTCY